MTPPKWLYNVIKYVCNQDMRLIGSESTFLIGCFVCYEKISQSLFTKHKKGRLDIFEGVLIFWIFCSFLTVVGQTGWLFHTSCLTAKWMRMEAWGLIWCIVCEHQHHPKEGTFKVPPCTCCTGKVWKGMYSVLRYLLANVSFHPWF